MRTTTSKHIHMLDSMLGVSNVGNAPSMTLVVQKDTHT